MMVQIKDKYVIAYYFTSLCFASPRFTGPIFTSPVQSSQSSKYSINFPGS